MRIRHGTIRYSYPTVEDVGKNLLSFVTVKNTQTRYCTSSVLLIHKTSFITKKLHLFRNLKTLPQVSTII